MKHPDMPKRPLTAYFKFFQAKRDKYARENPKLSMTELSKFIASKYNSYPEKKKVITFHKNYIVQKL